MIFDGLVLFYAFFGLVCWSTDAVFASLGKVFVLDEADELMSRGFKDPKSKH